MQNEAALMCCRIRAVEHGSAATGWSTLRFEKLNLAKLHKNWECAYSTQEIIRFFVIYRGPANF